MRRNLDSNVPTPAEMNAEIIALRAMLQVSEVRVKAEEAKTAELQKTLQAKEDQIAWLVRFAASQPASQQPPRTHRPPHDGALAPPPPGGG